MLAMMILRYHCDTVIVVWSAWKGTPFNVHVDTGPSFSLLELLMIVSSNVLSFRLPKLSHLLNRHLSFSPKHNFDSNDLYKNGFRESVHRCNFILWGAVFRDSGLSVSCTSLVPVLIFFVNHMRNLRFVLFGMPLILLTWLSYTDSFISYCTSFCTFP